MFEKLKEKILNKRIQIADKKYAGYSKPEKEYFLDYAFHHGKIHENTPEFFFYARQYYFDLFEESCIFPHELESRMPKRFLQDDFKIALKACVAFGGSVLTHFNKSYANNSRMFSASMEKKRIHSSSYADLKCFSEEIQMHRPSVIQKVLHVPENFEQCLPEFLDDEEIATLAVGSDRYWLGIYASERLKKTESFINTIKAAKEAYDRKHADDCFDPHFACYCD